MTAKFLRGPGAAVLPLLVLLFACSRDTATAEADDRKAQPRDYWEGQSENGVFAVATWPSSGRVGIGELQDWVVRVATAEGAAVYPASISVGGGMQGHGHGLPTQPLVTGYGGDGEYRIEGMRLSMAGRWTLAFHIQSDQGSDRAVLEIDVRPPEVSGWDGWSAAERNALATLALPMELTAPPSPSNRYADDAKAAAFGEALFFDADLAGTDVSCGTCHQPEQYFTDGMARSKGTGETLRNAPTIVGAAFNRWFYWDGRRDSLWSQALIPFEAADEMGSSRVGVLRRVAADPDLRERYEQLFGELPAEELAAIADAEAGPLGSPPMRDAWNRVPLAEQRAINGAFANLGKALAAYERTLLPEATRFDRFVRAVSGGMKPAEGDLLTADELAGARLFVDPDKTQCMQCHNGHLGSNGEFHNIGSGNFTGPRLDFGRVFGLRAVLMDEFNCQGPYSDAEPHECVELLYLNKDSHIPLQGAFKTPTLRGLPRTAPYFHDGRFATLDEVLDWYNDPPPVEQVGPHELRPLNLSDLELRNLKAFLLTLSN